MENQYTESISEWYDQIMEAGYYDHDGHAEALVKIISPGSKILELGIGTGLLAEKLVTKGYIVTGIDFSPAMLKFAEKRLKGNAEVLEQDVTKLDLPEKFDAAISEGGVWVIEKDTEGNLLLESHITDFEANSRGLKKVCEHLKDGGLLILKVTAHHQDSTLTLKDGAIYSQTAKYDLPWIYKEYFVKKDGKTLAHQKSKFRLFTNEEGESLLNKAGFIKVGLDESKQFMIFRKKVN